MKTIIGGNRYDIKSIAYELRPALPEGVKVVIVDITDIGEGAIEVEYYLIY